MINNNEDFETIQRRVIELAIRLGLIFVLVFWCFTLIEPFVLVVSWGIIVAIALFPLFTKLARVVGGREKLAATIITLALVALLVVPTVYLADSLLESATGLADSGELQIMEPPETVADWPLIGERFYSTWQRAAVDLPQVLEEYSEQVKAFGSWLLDTVAGTGLGVLQFIISFIIGGVFMATAGKGQHAAEALAARLAGSSGKQFSQLATGTIRNVAVGIVGVSIVQTTLLSVGFVIVDLPAAGLAALIALVLCIIQVGPGLVSVVAIIYVCSTMDTMPATLFTIYTLVMTVIDSVLKPLVFGRGASVPTLVIFLGAIGGMLAYGIIGLFVGAVVLSVGYTLYTVWLAQTPMSETTSGES